MLVIVGASGTGKSAIRNYLISKYQMDKVVSCTSRPMREGEVDGQDYFFLQKEEFEDRIQKDWFVEYTLYNDNYYGIPKHQIKDNSIAIVEPDGVVALKKQEDLNLTIIYLQSLTSVRKERMRKRGDTEEQIVQRIELDDLRFKSVKEDTNCIVDNDGNSIEEIADFVFNLYNIENKLNQ
jgi:guanylate kinase